MTQATNPALRQLESWLRASGIFCSDITDAATGQVGLFVDYRDASKRQEKLIAGQVRKLGLTVSVGDKGACFFGRVS